MKSTGSVVWPLRACPTVFAAGRYTQQDRDFRTDYRNPCLTIHCFAYAATVRIDGVEHDVRPGDVTITPPGASLRFAITRAGVHWCVRLRPAAAMGPGLLSLPVLSRLGSGAAMEARRRMEGVIADWARADGAADHPAAVAAGMGTQSLLCWLASGEAPAMPADDAVEKARRLLANQQCARVPISEIARRSGRSQNRLAIAFRARLGVSMRQYRLRCLMETATQLMQTTSLSMAAIRRRVEIPDAHHFNKVFRRVMGVGPRAWLAAQAPLATSSARPEDET